MESKNYSSCPAWRWLSAFPETANCAVNFSGIQGLIDEACLKGCFIFFKENTSLFVYGCLIFFNPVTL